MQARSATEDSPAPPSRERAFSNARPLPLNDKQRTRLATLGLTADEYEAFCSAFVGRPFDFNRKRAGQEWRPVQRRGQQRGVGLGAGHLLGHLEGDHSIGTRARWDAGRRRTWTPWFLIDLDAGPDLCQRYGKITRLLGKPTFVWRSSESKGLHLYYWLSEPVELYELRHDNGVRGLLLDVLERAGIPEKDGLVEVYPRGSTRRYGFQKAIRLPCGRGSMLLDPDDLSPLHSGHASGCHGWLGRRADLRFVLDRLATGEHTTHSVASLTALRDALPKPETPIRRRSGRRAPDALPYLEHGLERAGQLGVAVYAVARHFWRAGYSEAGARQQTHDWLDAMHNGRSRTYNKNPAGAHRRASDAVTSAFKDGPFVGYAPLPALSAWEARSIILPTLAPGACVDPLTGRAMKPYDVQTFLWRVAQAAKQWETAELGRVYIDQTGGIVGGKQERVARRVVSAAAETWPDPSRPEFIIQQPRSYRESFDRVNPRNLAALQRIADRLGVCGQLPGYVPGKGFGHCLKYRVRLDFGAIDGIDGAFASLDHALAVLLSPAEKCRTYTRHTRAKIVRAGAADDVGATAPTQAPSPVLDIVRAYLNSPAAVAAKAA